MGDADLTKINQRFEELDRATQLRLFEAFLDGKEIQVFHSEMRWKSNIYPAWLPSTAYRVAPEPLIPEPLIPDSIDWSHVADHLVCMARDSSDRCFGYTSGPEIIGSVWVSGANYRRIDDRFASYRRGTVDWRDSLVWRPGHGPKGAL